MVFTSEKLFFSFYLGTFLHLFFKKTFPDFKGLLGEFLKNHFLGPKKGGAFGFYFGGPLGFFFKVFWAV